MEITMNKKTILTISSANMDLNMRVPEAPAKGQTVFGSSYRYVPGGKGANSAVTLAKLGADSVFCTALGNDTNGDTLKSLYKDYGINTEYILTTENAPTGLAAVTVEADGANRITVFSGANSLLSPEHAVKSIQKSRPDAVFCHFEIPFETVCAASECCSGSGIPLFIDAGPADASLPLSELSPVFVFSPNETETEIFTGIAPTDEKSCVLACEKLSELVKARYYVIKLGARGVGVYDKGKFTIVPTYDVKVVDTTAAGDSFTAAMTLEYICSKDILRACRYGNAVASVTVSRPGAGESVPTVSELEKFLRENGISL